MNNSVSSSDLSSAGTATSRRAAPATQRYPGFSRRILAWYDESGRKDLPWKKSGNAYAIWVSEVMLQQTQVTTVIPYFHRFLARFPDIQTLAHAQLDEVLHQWTGLGYYARARNLHRAARIIVSDYHGVFPRAQQTVEALPGIGRSTAAAILALAFDERHAILDGNVKRVLARHHAIATPLNQAATQEALWRLAERHTPTARVADYTQAMMDLGATVCRRSRPRCDECPLRRTCAAKRNGDPENYPVPALRKNLPVRSVRMLMIRDHAGRILLCRRPPVGVWGGLWGFPQCQTTDVNQWCRAALGLEIVAERDWPKLRHSFTHFHLDITPIPARLKSANLRAMEHGEVVWYNLAQPDERGLPAPVKRLLEQLKASRNFAETE